MDSIRFAVLRTGTDCFSLKSRKITSMSWLDASKKKNSLKSFWRTTMAVPVRPLGSFPRVSRVIFENSFSFIPKTWRNGGSRRNQESRKATWIMCANPETLPGKYSARKKVSRLNRCNTKNPERFHKSVFGETRLFFVIRFGSLMAVIWTNGLFPSTGLF